MKLLVRLVLLFAFGAAALCAQTPAAPAPVKKNWTPPSYKIYGQTLSDEIMAAHPELLSVTLHGVPLEPLEKTIALGKKLALYRAKLTAKAFFSRPC